MTKNKYEDAAKRMKEIIDAYSDTEQCHMVMDGFLCELLKEEGYHEVVELFEVQDRWYS